MSLNHQPTSAWLWMAVVAALGVVVAYAPNLIDLGKTWWDDPNYSHGFLVIPITVFILWRRLASTAEELPEEIRLASRWGWVFLIAVLVVRAIAYERELQWVENATILPAIAGLTWTFGGWPLLRRIWPAIAFLVFMLPLPEVLNTLISLPLQTIATTGSYFLLQLSGFWVMQKGNIIDLQTPFGMRQLDVALACNGLKMLMTLIATVTATVSLLPLPTWKRITLLVSAVPTALISNILRITTTGWCYYYLKGGLAKQWAHDISGVMMMPTALILVGLELALLSWLVPEGVVEDDARKSVITHFKNQSQTGPAKDRSKHKDLGELP
jgi:exosortase